MYPGAVLEHDTGQVARCERAVDIAVKALQAKQGQIAAVVDMRMAEYDAIKLGRVKIEGAIFFNGFKALALVEAALDENLAPVGFQEVFGTGRGASGTEKM